MGYEILMSEDFMQSLDEILNMIKVLDNPYAASAYNDDLERITQLISVFPDSFKEKEGRPGTRYSMVKNYILFFTVDDEEMTVAFLDIVYSKRLL